MRLGRSLLEHPCNTRLLHKAKDFGITAGKCLLGTIRTMSLRIYGAKLRTMYANQFISTLSLSSTEHSGAFELLAPAESHGK
jgi:hypothetical protein